MGAHGRYTLLRKIADGGTGEVFLAQMEGSAGFKRLVVLKRVRPNLWADESFRKMLIDEAHISMALHHSNIVQVLDLGVASGHYFLAFELIDGWTLSQVVNRAKRAGVELPLNLAFHLMAETCRALAYAHGKTLKGQPMGIVHRDVTPQNVLVSEQGEVKLSDFGIAKARSRLTVSEIGKVKGKPAFMSPEQATGGELDARSDLFAVGVMLYWMVVGELPFQGATELESLAKVARGNYVHADKRRADLPKPVSRLITKSLEVDVKKRFQSADELLGELEAIQRKVLEPAGQTELKAWLAALSAKDGAKALVRADDTVPPVKLEDSQPIELVDEADIVAVVTQPEEALPARLDVPPAGIADGSGGRLLAGLLALALAAGGAWWLLRTPKPPPPQVAVPVAAADAGITPTVLLPPLAIPLEPPDAAVAGDAGVASADAGAETDAGEATADAGEAADAGSAASEALDAGSVAETPEDAGAAAAKKEPLKTEPKKEPPRQEPKKEAPKQEAKKEAPKQETKKEAPKKEEPPRNEKAKNEKTPPKTEADETMISVQMESEPKGAEVSIDKRVFGHTPMPLRLKIGITFELTFSKPGYKTQKVLRLVNKRQGQRVFVTLQPGK